MKPYPIMKPAEMNHSSLCKTLFSYITLIFYSQSSFTSKALIHLSNLSMQHSCEIDQDSYYELSLTDREAEIKNV